MNSVDLYTATNHESRPSVLMFTTHNVRISLPHKCHKLSQHGEVTHNHHTSGETQLNIWSKMFKQELHGPMSPQLLFCQRAGKLRSTEVFPSVTYLFCCLHAHNFPLSPVLRSPIPYPITHPFVNLPSQAKSGSWLYFRAVTRTRTTRTLTQTLPEGVVLGFWNFACGPYLPKE